MEYIYTMKKPKTKISGIVDNSSMGIAVNSYTDTEMLISKATEKKLRKLISKSKFFTLVSGVAMTGNSKWLLTLDEDCKVVYEFKIGKNGGSTFLNVTGNPTKLMRGSNDIPVLLKDKRYSKNAALNTFMYANRILYAILEFIPDFKFEWGVERDRLQLGDINITRFQLAWYSGDLADKRNDVLRFLRTSYGGLNATKGKVENIGTNIEVNTRLWDNHSNNLTMEKKAGNSKEFSITLYSKDEDPTFDGDKSRLCNLIRFDCTFFSYFFGKVGIKTVRDLEAVYQEKCLEGGYDIGFVRWLANHVYDNLHFRYIVRLSGEKYKESLEKMERIAEDTKALNRSKLARHWLKYGDKLDIKTAETIGVNKNRLTPYIESIKEKTGIDVTISRSFHEALMLNRRFSHMTYEERADLLMSNSNNQKMDILAALEERDEKSVAEIYSVIFEKSALIKRMVPKTLKYNDFWAYRHMNEVARELGLEIEQ